ncbi:uncharacterized protein [Manis javanica]|uniref:uncharacterized protein n=1 Tax=Manis javanica TaxID=9974 RepID=UPI003C6CE6C9
MATPTFSTHNPDHVRDGSGFEEWWTLHGQGSRKRGEQARAVPPAGRPGPRGKVKGSGCGQERPHREGSSARTSRRLLSERRARGAVRRLGYSGVDGCARPSEALCCSFRWARSFRIWICSVLTCSHFIQSFWLPHLHWPLTRCYPDFGSRLQGGSSFRPPLRQTAGSRAGDPSLRAGRGDQRSLTGAGSGSSGEQGDARRSSSGSRTRAAPAPCRPESAPPRRRLRTDPWGRRFSPARCYKGLTNTGAFLEAHFGEHEQGRGVGRGEREKIAPGGKGTGKRGGRHRRREDLRRGRQRRCWATHRGCGFRRCLWATAAPLPGALPPFPDPHGNPVPPQAAELLARHLV